METLALLGSLLTTLTETAPATDSPEVVTLEVTSHCAKCGEELTDAASIEAGIGPVCRKIANATLATMIPADLEGARARIADVIGFAVAPCARPTMAKIVNTMIEGTNDWRETVKRLAWVLSKGTSYANRELMIGAVEKLGYVGYANVLRNEAVSGKAMVTVENGRIVLVAPNKKAAREALKKINGRMFHPKGALKDVPCWSFPASEVRAFWTTLTAYYPNHDASFVKLVSECSKIVAEKAPEAAPEAPKAKVTVTESYYGGVELASPYNPAFVAELKTLHYNDRKWNPTKKVWWVSKEVRETALAMVEKHYGAGSIVMAPAAAA